MAEPGAEPLKSVLTSIFADTAREQKVPVAELPGAKKKLIDLTTPSLQDRVIKAKLVRWFPAKGFGWAENLQPDKPQDKEEFFIHEKNVLRNKPSDVPTLKVGMILSFLLEEDHARPGAPQALVGGGGDKVCPSHGLLLASLSTVKQRNPRRAIASASAQKQAEQESR